MSHISKEHYDHLAAFVARVKDRVYLHDDALRSKIYGITIQPFEVYGKRNPKVLTGWDFDGNIFFFHSNGCNDAVRQTINDLVVETTETIHAPLPYVTPETIHNLYNEGELYFYDQKINHLILTPDEKSFAGSFKKKDGTYGVFCGAFNQTKHFGFYSKTETTTRVPFAEAFKQFQSNALNG